MRSKGLRAPPIVFYSSARKTLGEGLRMTKATGIGRGGRRAGGRPPGSKNKKTVLAELLPKLEAADQELPLYRLLRRIRDPEVDERYRDVLAIATLPFLHPRMRSDLTAKPLANSWASL
jgi:hypothetical protein